VKRIVFVHPNGMHQILGHAPAEYPITLPLPGTPPMDLLGKEVPFASLVKVTERMAVYKEPMIPGTHTYTKDARQV
jgi:hypothetical protein